MSVEAAPSHVGAVGRARLSVDAIELLAEIRRQARTVATPDERQVLGQWSGWGPLAKVFAPDSTTWEQLADRIAKALSESDVRIGQRGIYNAFYTPEPIAEAMWGLLQALGYTGGPVLEPGCGGGVFMRTAPQGVRVTGVERDPTAADICALLNPGHTVIQGEFQRTKLRGGFAAVIGNVPFGNVAVYDPTAPRAVQQSLHNYFIWKACRQLAPGGIAVLLTSRFTMDSAMEYARTEISEIADFVGAIRLAAGDLEGDGDDRAGGTKACADIIILRRKGDTETKPREWLATTRDLVPDQYVNAWWDGRSQYVLGDMVEGKTTQYGLGVVVNRPDGRQPAADLIRKVGRWLVAEAQARGLAWSPAPDVSTLDADLVDEVTNADGRDEGSIWLDGDDVLQVKDGRVRKIPSPTQQLRLLTWMLDATKQLMAAEADYSRSDADITPIRKALADAYADYREHFGPLNACSLRTKYTEVKPNTELAADVEAGLRPAVERDGKLYVTETIRTPQNNRATNEIRKDPDASMLWAIEVYDDDTGESRPAPILSARQNVPPVRPTHADDPAQALHWSLNYSGGVDVPYIAGLLRVQPEQVPGLLGDAVFVDPATRDLVVAEEYLSGDVRDKLRVAKKAAAADEAFARNVAALEVALPKWLTGAEITVQLGAPWIGKHYIEQFMAELLCGVHPSESANRTYVRLTRVSATNAWEIESGTTWKQSVAATTTWGTKDVDGFRLIALALNGKIPEVKREVEEDVWRRDEEATMLAITKQQEIKEKYAEWIWEEPERARTLETLYNEKFNNLVARQFDGSHITIDGMAPGFKPYAHQLEYVARALATPAALCGHPVGAGKTKTMVMVVKKMRDLDLIKKPLLVVPNHLVAQTEREARQLFPGARILAAGSEMFSSTRKVGRTTRSGREWFAARVATQQWDLVIITHSMFDRLGVAPATEIAYLEQQEIELAESIAEAWPDGKPQGRLAKNTAKRLDTMRERLRSLRDRAKGHDRGVTFEQLGVDYLCLDEAHYYKNLALPCRTDGFSVRPSKRATELDMKLGWLAQRGGGRYASLFTGTPVSNTMLELYVVLHYTMPDYLREIGLGSADSWAAQYVMFETTIDVTVDGGSFKWRTKPSKFVNAPELRVLLSQTADIRTAEQLGLERPAVEVRVEVCRPTRAQRDYSRELVDRAETVSHQRKPEPGGDNMLKICGDGRRMATDPALVGIHDPDPGKLERVARNVVNVWRDHPEDVQIVFCDLGTPKGDDTQTYGRIKRLLVEQGMPHSKIRFIHEATNDGYKAQLFAACRSGEIQVIMGSTDKLGVGTNIQDRIVAMHHVDAPFRPADVEQRDGRGRRPGNRNKKVAIWRYVTQRTFDAYMWQLLTVKIGFIEQMMSGNLTEREIEDVGGEQTISFAAVKASAAGQPLLLEKNKVVAELKKLRNAQRGYRMAVDRLKSDIANYRAANRSYATRIATWEAIAAVIGEPTEDVAKHLHEVMKEGFGWRLPKTTAMGVTFKFDSWINSFKGKEERHPKAIISVREHQVEQKWRSYWKPDRILEELNDLVNDAASEPKSLRWFVENNDAKIADAERELAKPFTHGERIVELETRLQQIEAELRKAAAETKGEDGDDVDDERYDVEDFAGEFDLGGQVVMSTEAADDDLEDLEEAVADGRDIDDQPEPEPVSEPAPEPAHELAGDESPIVAAVAAGDVDINAVFDLALAGIQAQLAQSLAHAYGADILTNR